MLGWDFPTRLLVGCLPDAWYAECVVGIKINVIRGGGEHSFGAGRCGFMWEYT